jgi:hypothetical protein
LVFDDGLVLEIIRGRQYFNIALRWPFWGREVDAGKQAGEEGECKEEKGCCFGEIHQYSKGI